MGRPKLPQCKRGHDISIVGRFNGKRDGYGPCKLCNLINARKFRSERVEKLKQIKLTSGCKYCGYKKSAWSLDFHHRDSSTKEFVIAQKPFTVWSKLLEEIEKCDIVCRNCHGELHESEQG